jgi:hypothetical protein
VQVDSTRRHNPELQVRHLPHYGNLCVDQQETVCMNLLHEISFM